MKAKITHGGVTVELEDATAEDVERVLSAIGDKRPAFEPIKELAPPSFQPFVPVWIDPTQYTPAHTTPHVGPFITWTTTSDRAEVPS